MIKNLIILVLFAIIIALSYAIFTGQVCSCHLKGSCQDQNNGRIIKIYG